MARALPNSRINREAIDSHDAYNRSLNRADDIAKDREDPQPGPVENRRRAASRKASK